MFGARDSIFGQGLLPSSRVSRTWHGLKTLYVFTYGRANASRQIYAIRLVPRSISPLAGSDPFAPKTPRDRSDLAAPHQRVARCYRSWMGLARFLRRKLVPWG